MMQDLQKNFPPGYGAIIVDVPCAREMGWERAQAFANKQIKLAYLALYKHGCRRLRPTQIDPVYGGLRFIVRGRPQ